MNWKESFLKEEIRSGFPVNEKRKKVWAVELELLQKFDEVCRKYNLTYYAYYGTLLGAVRHQGFIPWDDDIDVVMFREDYEKLQAVAPEEFREPYFFQNSYTDQMLWFFSKLRDSRTTAIEFPARNLHQGIFIDIFPLDDVPDGVHEEFSAVLEVQREIWYTIHNPGKILQDLESGKRFTLDMDVLVALIKMDRSQRLREFETFSLSYAGQSENVNLITSELSNDHYKSVKRAWFQEKIYMPFEGIQIPVPAKYDKILIQSYGAYHQFVPGGTSHENIILEPDMPYQEYFAKFIPEH